MPAEPDAVLMRRVKRGDTRAFAELVDKYKQPVINFLTRTLRDETEAEDLAQNVFVQVYWSARRSQTVQESAAHPSRRQCVCARRNPGLA